MSAPQFFVTPGYGDFALRELGYRQAVRVGDRVDISGQGGWFDDITFPEALEDEIARAFDNVERTLAEAGATWADVIAVDSFHLPDSDVSIGERPTRLMTEQLRLRMGERAPIWTQIGVAALGAPGMRVEVRVTAIVGSGG